MRRLGEHLRGLLEGRRGDERLGGQRRLGDPEQQGLGRGPLLARRIHALVGLLEEHAIHVLSHQEIGIAHVVHADLAHHLPDNHLDVLVVDLDALEAVDLLDLVHHVLGEFLVPLDPQYVVGIGGAIHERLTVAHPVPLVHADVLALRDQVLAGLPDLFFRRDNDTAFAA